MKTNQEIFNQVAEHMLHQGEPAVHSDGGCMYRFQGEDRAKTLKCAVGCLIPDSVYSETIEGGQISSLLHRSTEAADPENLALATALKNSGISRKSYALLHELQDIHDNFEAASWPEFLRDLAQEHRLTLPACLQEVAP